MVVGLGNPGRKFAATRHNLGFRAVEEFSRQMRLAGAGERCGSLIERGNVGGEAVVVARPQTFMNRSGDAVSSLLDWCGAEPGDLLVVCDDVAIDLGRIRVRASGSDGGHLGLRSVIRSVGTREFPRVRIGIRTPTLLDEDLAEAVLSPFSPEESELASRQTVRAAECLQVILERGVEAAMNLYNRKQIEEAHGTGDS